MKSHKKLSRQEYIEHLTETIIAHQLRITDMLESIKDTRKAINETKKHIRKYQALLKDAENTEVDYYELRNVYKLSF
jgi:peptidoglycan hydrolase CwlO-like protein